MSVTLKTSLGNIKVELHCDAAPKACENFLALCASSYYIGTVFHRNIKGFMVQGGDPTGTGRGGESIWKAPFPDEIQAHLGHTKRGVLSMANSGPDTNGSQFFFTYGKHPHLDNAYTVFGRIIDGFETLDLMERVPVDSNDKPLSPITIESIEIHANPIALAADGV
eukprot:TRINITY_DN5573_c0_g1_i1.p1 TRINITY_DN5573_c0_g1~~TRINITY_DN5573_c0_g1_i1.p1  ORF type:complete len:180 (-),score=48.38 TRINITY_DN5573_c0_g1_i1:31-528(-)